MHEQLVITDVELRETLQRNQISSILSDNEREYYSNLKTQRRRNEWLKGRIAAKKLIQKFLHEGKKSLAAIEIKADSNGKPFGAGEFSISISHKGDIAVAALSSCPIGIDIEDLKIVSDRMQNFFLSDAEKLDFNSVYGIHGPVIAWTIKEAYLKALGTGFRRSPKSLEVKIGAAQDTFSIDKDGEIQNVDVSLSLNNSNCITSVVLN